MKASGNVKSNDCIANGTFHELKAFKENSSGGNDAKAQEALESKSQHENEVRLCPFLPDKKYLRILKPLVPLKLSLFLWFAAGAILVPYFNLYFIQLGISVKQLSLILTLNPILQFIGPTISGIIADKIGRSKPVLVTNLILVGVVANSLLLVPSINHRKCYIEGTEILCKPQFSVKINGTWAVSPYVCFTQCISEEFNFGYFKMNRTHQVSDKTNETVAIPENLLQFFDRTELGEHFSSNITHLNSTTFCNVVMNENCTTYCGEKNEVGEQWRNPHCPDVEDNSTLVFSICLLISCLFAALLSNCYRFMDVTSIFMVKKYNTDFGRERFWSILSVVILSPLAGHLVDLTTPKGAPRNCAFAFYIFDFLLILMMASVYKLEAQINPPGRNMWRKAVKLIKNMDIAAFTLALLVLGTSWGFTKIFSFIYLDQLGSPSILMGVLLAVNSICGLPFLVTSNWWIKTLGTSNILVLGFVGYIILSLGFSFIVNPWHALIFEMSSVLTYHLLWVAVIRHSHDIAPVGLSATVVSAAGGIHYALGKGTGSLIGGQIMGRYGGRWSYRMIAIICGVTAVIYGIFLHFRRVQMRNGKAEKELKDVVSASSDVTGDLKADASS